MKKTSGIIIVIILMFSFMMLASGGKPCTAGDPPDLTDAYQRALGYLAGSQNPDGSWGTLPERDTTLAAEALAVSANTDYQDNLDLASVWLSQTQARNLDYVSRKIWLDSITGCSTASDEERWFPYSCLNENWGMGLAPGLSGTPLDTSIGFRGFLIRGDIYSISSILSYLYDAGNGEAYSLFTGGPSDLFTTASVAKAFNMTGYFAQSPDLAQLANAELREKTRAVDAYLASVQHPDGGFGEQGSTAYETALVLDAVSWSATSSVDVLKAASFLLDRQRADGSISGDTATTAMFCSAVWAKPYFPAAAISFDEDSIPENNPLKGTIKIGNMGLLPTGSFELSVALDDPDNTIASITAEDIPACGLVTVPFEVAVTNAARGTHDLYVRLSNAFATDTNLYDNLATGSFCVKAGCNFTLVSASCSPEIPQASKYIELKAIVGNSSEKGMGPLFSPNGDGKLDSATIHATPTEDCQLSISLINQAGRNVGLVYGPVRVGSSGFDYAWDGRVGGYMRADGAYTLEADLLDDAGFTYTTSTPVTLDTSPPTLSSPNISMETSEVKVEVESDGASTVIAHFNGETLELVQDNGIYKGSFDRPAEAGSYPIYVVAEDSAGNAISSDTFAVLVSTLDYSKTWVQTTQDDFQAGEEKNGTDIGTSPGNHSHAARTCRLARIRAIRTISGAYR